MLTEFFVVDFLEALTRITPAYGQSILRKVPKALAENLTGKLHQRIHFHQYKRSCSFLSLNKVNFSAFPMGDHQAFVLYSEMTPCYLLDIHFSSFSEQTALI